jgi:acyl dehydratase
MSMLPEGVAAYIGVSTDHEFAPEAVEAGAVRRFAQAIMDDDPVYWQEGPATARHGGPVAPPLFPTAMFRRPFGTPDPFAEQAGNPDYDGAGTIATMGLPEILPFRGYNVLAGGSEVEFTRYAKWGERVRVRSSYADIEAKQTSKGMLFLIHILSEFTTTEGELLMRVRRTSLRRPV